MSIDSHFASEWVRQNNTIIKVHKRERWFWSRSHQACSEDKMNPDQQFKATTMTSASISNGLYDHEHNRLKNGDSHKQSHRKSQYSNSTMVHNHNENGEEEAGHTLGVGQRETTKNFTIIMPPCPSSSSESAFSIPSSMITPPKNREHHQPMEHVLSSTSHETDEFYSKNICIASTLVMTYLIEVTVQVSNSKSQNLCDFWWQILILKYFYVGLNCFFFFCTCLPLKQITTCLKYHKLSIFLVFLSFSGLSDFQILAICLIYILFRILRFKVLSFVLKSSQ